MSHDRYTIELAGCAPIPLAHYLKALGILRLVSEQVDHQTQGWWKGDTFSLRSVLDREGLVKFFLERYEPTPIVAPWNGGSGFYASDRQEALRAISSGRARRFARYRQIIGTCHTLLTSMSLDAKPGENDKDELLLRCRNQFPDNALRWLDTALLLTEEGPKYPPLLGTGGNDGRLEFTNNFMQRLCELIDPDTGESVEEGQEALPEALFATVGQERNKSPIGQFDPGSTGGANAASGYAGASSINTWDYVLTLEGALAFAAAAVKKLEHVEPGVLAYPFCVHSAGVGYGSANEADVAASRNEMWFPLWDTPAYFGEVTALLAEGRVELRGRRAHNGVDFARAIASLGVDRGIRSFERYGFQQRNGLAYFAVPLGRFDVRGNPQIEELLATVHSWLHRFRRTATAKNAPARAGRALRGLEKAILELCRRGERRHVQHVLIALGQAEAAVAASRRLRDPKSGIGPVPLLSPQWLAAANDDSAEFRLTAALASIGFDDKQIGPFRRHLEPIDPKTWNSRWPKWSDTADDPNIVWGGGGLVRNLIAVLNRRTIEAFRHGKQPGDEVLLFPGAGRSNASLGDVATFVDGDIDDERIEALLWGLMLVDWRHKGVFDAIRRLRGPREPAPDAAYALLKLCHLPDKIDGKSVPLTPSITHRAVAGDLAGATLLATRRLRGSGLSPAVEVVHGHGRRARRTVAALMFPVWHSEQAGKTTDLRRLRDLCCRVDSSEPDEDTAEAAGRRPAAV
jgi:CRISPR-associated protein Csx17